MNAPNPINMSCRTCGEPTIGWGKDKHGNPRRKCKACRSTFGIIPARPLGAMRLDLDQARLCLHLLTEGSSIRSTERVSGVHRDTICGSCGSLAQSAKRSSRGWCAGWTRTTSRRMSCGASWG